MIIFASAKPKMTQISGYGNFTPFGISDPPGSLALDSPSEVEQSLGLLAGIVTL